MTQEVDWKSVATGLMEGWILPQWPRRQHYSSSVGSSWQSTEQKAAGIQRRDVECASRSLENYSWKLLWIIAKKCVWGKKKKKVIIWNTDFQACWNCTKSILLFLHFNNNTFQVPLHLFPAFLPIYKEVRNGSRLLQGTVCAVWLHELVFPYRITAAFQTACWTRTFT